jgi:hypothetical protein
MNQQHARLGLALGNLVLTAGLLAIGYETFLTRREPPKDSAVPSYEPTQLALPAQARAQDPFAEYTVVWTQIDKPPPPPPPVEHNPADDKPKIEDLSTKFKVTLVQLFTDSTANMALLEPKTGGDTLLVKVNEQLPLTFKDYKCTAIDQDKDGACIVTLLDPSGHPSKIKLKTD